MEASEALQVVVELLGDDSAPEAIASLRGALKEAREARVVREALDKLYGNEDRAWVQVLSAVQEDARAADLEQSQRVRLARHLGEKADWDAISDRVVDLKGYNDEAVRWTEVGAMLGLVDASETAVRGRIDRFLLLASDTAAIREAFFGVEAKGSVVDKLKSVPERWANALGRNDCPGVEEMLAETRSLRGLRDELARDWGCAPEDLSESLDEATTWASVGEHLGFMGGNKMSVKARIAELRELSRSASETLRCDPVDILGDLSAKLEELERWRKRSDYAEIRLDEAKRLTAEIRQERDALRDEVAAYRAVLAAEIRRVS